MKLNVTCIISLSTTSNVSEDTKVSSIIFQVGTLMIPNSGLQVQSFAKEVFNMIRGRKDWCYGTKLRSNGEVHHSNAVPCGIDSERQVDARITAKDGGTTVSDPDFENATDNLFWMPTNIEVSRTNIMSEIILPLTHNRPRNTPNGQQVLIPVIPTRHDWKIIIIHRKGILPPAGILITRMAGMIVTVGPERPIGRSSLEHGGSIEMLAKVRAVQRGRNLVLVHLALDP
mmetsp:Transcript_52933/g.78460  ORF Transcript_52933/g.78460 Transcript_52933/m.78460 type:complete len:229 (-) Transcript_52933:930-1616(-)